MSQDTQGFSGRMRTLRREVRVKVGGLLDESIEVRVVLLHLLAHVDWRQPLTAVCERQKLSQCGSLSNVQIRDAVKEIEPMDECHAAHLGE